MSDANSGLPAADLQMLDALSALAVDCWRRVPPGVPVAGAAVTITYLDLGDVHAPAMCTDLAFSPNQHLDNLAPEILRHMAHRLLARAVEIEQHPT